MPGRTYAVGSAYRYGFNGKEQDSAVNGTGVDYDYGARIYDARVARFLSVDPLERKYPELSDFQFASNSPIDGIDRDGKEFLEPQSESDEESNETEADQNLSENNSSIVKSPEEAREEFKETHEEDGNGNWIPKPPRVRTMDEYFEEIKNTVKNAKQLANNYVKNAIAAGQWIFGEPINIVPMHPLSPDYAMSNGNVQINRANGKIFETEVQGFINNNPNAENISRQITLVATGELNKIPVKAEIVIDFANSNINNDKIDLTEAKYSLKSITINNVVRTFTEQQKNFWYLVFNGNKVEISAVGDNASPLLNSDLVGKNIMAKIQSLTFVVTQKNTSSNSDLKASSKALPKSPK